MNGLASLYYREMRIWSRTGWMIILSISTPILYILLFGLSMTGLIGHMEYQGEQIDYLLFILPGIMAMGIHGSGMNVSWTFFSDKRWGALEQILSSPVTRSAYGLGKILSVVTQSFIQVFFILVVGLPLVKIKLFIANLPLLCFSAFLGGVCFCSLYIILASRIDSNDLLSTISNLIIFPMIFCSSMFYPLETMPSPVLKVIAQINPMTYLVDCLRASLIGSFSFQIGLELSVLSCFAIALFSISIFSIKRVHIYMH